MKITLRKQELANLFKIANYKNQCDKPFIRIGEGKIMIFTPHNTSLAMDLEGQGEGGGVAFSYFDLKDFVKLCDRHEAIVIETGENSVKITQGINQITTPILDDDFFEDLEIAGKAKTTIKRGVLKDVLDLLTPCVGGKKELKVENQSIVFNFKDEGLELTCTDTWRMLRKTIPIEKPITKFLILRNWEILNAMVGIAGAGDELSFAFDDGATEIVSGNFTFKTKHMEYPLRWDSIFLTQEQKETLDSGDIIKIPLPVEALDKVIKRIGKHDADVLFEIDKNTITLCSYTDDDRWAELETLDITTDFQRKILIRKNHLSHIVKFTKEECITLYCSRRKDAVEFECEFLCAAMPLMIPGDQ